MSDNSDFVVCFIFTFIQLSSFLASLQFFGR